MKLLITTLAADETLMNIHKSYISLLDTADGSLKDLVTFNGLNRGNLYGMCFANNLMYVSRDSSLLVYDTSFQLINTIPITIPCGEIHQIVSFENKVYLTNTQRDSIIIFDIANNAFSEFKIINSNSDTKHVNSIFFENGFIYLCCHNRGLSEIIQYDLDWNMKNIFQGGSSSHNVWRMKDKLWAFSSVTHSLYNITDNVPTKITLPNDNTGFYRGMVLADKLYFGASVFRKRMATAVKDVFQDINTGSICGVIIMNPDTLEVEQVIELTNKTGIQEMVELPVGFTV